MTIDRELPTIRQGLEAEFPKQEIDFYHSPARELWKPADVEEPNPAAEDEPVPVSATAILYIAETALEGIFMGERSF